MLVVIEYIGIACAILKQSQLFERGGTYEVDDASQIEAVQWIRTQALIYGMTYAYIDHRL